MTLSAWWASMIYLLLCSGGEASATTKSGVLSAPFMNSVRISGILTILIHSCLTLSFLPPACGMVFRRLEFLFSSPLGTFRFFFNLESLLTQKHGPSNFIEFSKFQILWKFLQVSTFLKIFKFSKIFQKLSSTEIKGGTLKYWIKVPVLLSILDSNSSGTEIFSTKI